MISSKRQPISPPSAVTPPPRFDWVDNAKVVLIFLVVLGHFSYAPVYGRTLIYAFHVPAFLVITGFLLPEDFGAVSLVRLWQKWIGPYVRAYALFSLIAIMIWWVLTSLAQVQLADPLPTILGSLYGVSGAEQGFGHHDRPLWYFPFLVVAMLGAWLCATVAYRLGPIIGGLLAVTYASVAVLYHGPRLPWCLDIAGMGTVLILAGHVIRHHYGRIQAFIAPPWRTVPLLLAFAALLVLLSHLNGTVNVNRAEFGRSGVLFVLAALSGTGVVALLASLIPATRPAQTISANTLTIFALHIYLVRAADALPVPNSSFLQQIIMAVLSALIILACLLLARILQPVLVRVVTLRSPVARNPGPGGALVRHALPER